MIDDLRDAQLIEQAESRPATTLPTKTATLPFQLAPVPPSLRSGRPMPEELERLILACLAKDPSDRPATAQTLDHDLAAIDLAPWCLEEARAWWETNLAASVVPSAVVFSNPGTIRVEVPVGR